MREFDAAIAGGGPAGTAAAITLARAGMRVILAHSGAAGPRIGEGLPASSRSLLDDLGVLDFMALDGHRPSFGTVSAWGSESLDARDTLYGLHGHGWQLDRARFDERLRMVAVSAGAELHRSMRIHPLSPASKGEPFELQCHSHSELNRDPLVRARWFIDAGGRTSNLSKSLGAQRRRSDALVAIYLRLPAAPDARDQDSATLVEADPTGWWYTALLPSGERIAAFLTDADLVENAGLLQPQAFMDALERTEHIKTRTSLHPATPMSRPQGADASTTFLDPPAGDRWLAVGDAATGYDPLSSKGISQALYTGRTAAQAVLAAEAGAITAITEYAQHVRDIFTVYQHQLRHYYAQEQRWKESPFWNRRRQTPAGDPR